MRTFLHFSFSESFDHRPLVELQAHELPLVPNVGDLIGATNRLQRIAVTRTVVAKRYTFGEDRCDVLLLCD